MLSQWLQTRTFYGYHDNVGTGLFFLYTHMHTYIPTYVYDFITLYYGVQIHIKVYIVKCMSACNTYLYYCCCCWFSFIFASFCFSFVFTYFSLVFYFFRSLDFFFLRALQKVLIALTAAYKCLCALVFYTIWHMYVCCMYICVFLCIWLILYYIKYIFFSFILPLLFSLLLLLLLLLLLYRCCFHYSLYKMVFHFKYEMKEFLCCNCCLLPSFITLLLTIWIRTHTRTLTHTRITFIIFISLHIRNQGSDVLGPAATVSMRYDAAALV